MKSNRPWDYWLLWFAALSSLALNVWLVNALLVARRQMGEAAGVAAQSVGALRGASIDYTFKVQQEVPVTANVPFHTTLDVPLKLSLPVNTEVTVPLKTPFGSFDLKIPISTTVPIDLKTQVPISTSFRIATTVPVSLEIPVKIAIADTSLGAALLKVEMKLLQVADFLQASPLTPRRQAP